MTSDRRPTRDCRQHDDERPQRLRAGQCTFGEPGRRAGVRGDPLELQSEPHQQPDQPDGRRDGLTRPESPDPPRTPCSRGPRRERDEGDRGIEALGEEGGHVVGHSSGAVAATLSAAASPGLVRSLVLFEPACFALARGGDEVERHVREMSPVFEDASEVGASDGGCAARFLTALGPSRRSRPNPRCRRWAGGCGRCRRRGTTCTTRRSSLPCRLW